MAGINYPNYLEIEPTEVDLLVDQIKMLREELVSIQTSFLSMISVALGAYGLIIYYAFNLDENCGADDANYLFIILPFLFLISFNNIIKYTAKMLGIGSYIRYLEGTLNSHYQKPLFQWHSYLIYANGYGAIGGFAQLPCFVALALLIGSKFIENTRKDFWGKPVFIVLIILELLFSLFSLLVCVTQSTSVEYWCNTVSTNYMPNTSRQFLTRILCWCKIKEEIKRHRNKPQHMQISTRKKLSKAKKR